MIGRDYKNQFYNDIIYINSRERDIYKWDEDKPVCNNYTNCIDGSKVFEYYLDRFGPESFNCDHISQSAVNNLGMHIF